MSATAEREIRTETIVPARPGELVVEALYGSISRGTERLVFLGRVPPSEYTRMRAPLMAGEFPFPVKYGYATVGRIVAGPDDMIGRTAFALHPHQTIFNLPADSATLVPPAVPPRRAVLAANMETALNALWDAAIGPADRVAVVGAGVVGSLCAFLAGRIPGTEVTLVDIEPGSRRNRRCAWGSLCAADGGAGGL